MKRTTLTGKVMDVFEVFDLERSSVSDHGSPDGRVLVVGDQVYPFVENPINARLLRTVRFGDPVQIEAEIIQEGHVVQIFALTRIDSAYTARDSIRNRRPSGRLVEIVVTLSRFKFRKLGSSDTSSTQRT